MPPTTRAAARLNDPSSTLLALNDDLLLHVIRRCGPAGAVRVSEVHSRLKRLAREDDIWRIFWEARAAAPQIQAASESICVSRSRSCSSVDEKEFKVTQLASVQRWQLPPLQGARSVFSQYAAKHMERASVKIWQHVCSSETAPAVLSEQTPCCTVEFRGRLYDSMCGGPVNTNEVGEPLRCEWPGCGEGRCCSSGCPHDWGDGSNPSLEFWSCGFCRITFCSSHVRRHGLLKVKSRDAQGRRQWLCIDCKA